MHRYHALSVYHTTSRVSNQIHMSTVNSISVYANYLAYESIVVKLAAFIKKISKLIKEVIKIRFLDISNITRFGICSEI